MVLEEAIVTCENGIEGDYGGQPGKRQVTVLSREAWEEACVQAKADLPWTTRRANLLVEGVDLDDSAGSRLRIGELLLEITGETTPCPKMDRAYPGLRAALAPSWRGGITCRVIEGSKIRTGDTVRMEPGG